MARRFLTALDLGKNELQNAAVQSLAGAPGSPVKFQLYGNTSDNTLYWWDGAQWIAAKAAAGATPAGTVTTSAVADASVVGVSTNFAREDHKHGREAFANPTATTTFGLAAVNGSATTLARSDHTHGTPTHDAAAHSTISHSALAAPTADISWGGFKLTSLGTPLAGTDATTKDYVDNLSAGISYKDAVRVASTANGTLATAFANGQTVDGVVLATGNRILLKDQSTGTENGIYVVTAGAPTRATDADAVGELDGAFVVSMEGTANADKAWICSTNPPITPGSTATTWAYYGAGTAYTAGAGLTLTGSTFDVVAADATITVTADAIARAALTGDVTTAVNAATIANNAVTNAKLADSPANSIKGNNTGSAADPLDLTVAQVKTLLAIANTDVTGLGPFAPSTKTSIVSTDIADGTVANGDLANMAANTFKGNNTGSPAAPQDVTVAAMQTALAIPSVASLSTTFVKLIAQDCAANVLTTVTHNFNSRDVKVEVYRNSTPWDTIDADIERPSVNAVDVRFATAPAAGAYRIVVEGIDL